MTLGSDIFKAGAFLGKMGPSPMNILPLSAVAAAWENGGRQEFISFSSPVQQRVIYVREGVRHHSVLAEDGEGREKK